MTRDEAIKKGKNVLPTIHSMKRRSTCHNYSGKGTYMLTLVVNGRHPLFGRLVSVAPVPEGSPSGKPVPVPEGSPSGKPAPVPEGSPSGKPAPVPEGSPSGKPVPVPEGSPSGKPVPVPEGSPSGKPAAKVELSPLGQLINDVEIKKINHFYPMVDVWQLCIMPDHIHIILRVKTDLPKGKTLGTVVSGFKAGCTKAWWRLSKAPVPSGSPSGNPAPVPSGSPLGKPAPVPSGSPSGKLPLLFEPGYNDRYIHGKNTLENWKAYLKDNPRRLWLKRLNPQLFTVMCNRIIAGRNCQMIGNFFLLDIPDKMAVIVHRRYSDEEYSRKREEWLACGERGGVLVSAAISPKEKEILREAMNLGYKIILLLENGFPEFYKPYGESFDACHNGLLLQISPWEHHYERKTITREQCLVLNDMAEQIAHVPEGSPSGNPAPVPSGSPLGKRVNPAPVPSGSPLGKDKKPS